MRIVHLQKKTARNKGIAKIDHQHDKSRPPLVEHEARFAVAQCHARGARIVSLKSTFYEFILVINVEKKISQRQLRSVAREIIFFAL